MTNSRLATCAIIAVASLMIAATISVGTAFAQPLQPPIPPIQPPGPPFSNQQLQVREELGDEVQVSPGSFEPSRATCDPGEVVTGGGFQVNAIVGSNTLDLISSKAVSVPSGLGTWEAQVLNDTPSTIGFTSVAECTKLVDAP